MQFRLLFSGSLVFVFASLTIFSNAASAPSDDEEKGAEFTGKLIKLLESFPRSHRPTAKDWIRVEKALSTKLPDDYKAAMGTIGMGTFLGDFTFLAPNEKWPDLDMANDVKGNPEIWEFIKEEAEADPENHPRALFPEKGGFLKFGESPDAFALCWDTEDPDPNNWPIVLVDLENSWYIREKFRMPFSEFLFRGLTGKLPEGGLGDAFRDLLKRDEPLFEAFE